MGVREEVTKAMQGYTLSVANKAVLGRFHDMYFMRSGGRRVTVPADTIDADALEVLWRRFRAEALGHHQDDSAAADVAANH